MKRGVVFTVLGILLFLFWGFSGNVIEFLKENPMGESRTEARTEDFLLSLETKKETYESGEPIDIWTTVKYEGRKPYQKIYHGGSIFYLAIHGVDHEFEQVFGMRQPLLSTTLYRNVTKIQTFEALQELKLPPGNYRIEALSDFSKTDDTGNNIQIPLELIIKIFN
ncbi:hypothetical protein [Evansella tamaricis]|uniref:Uncharacterized protein n=1 Tax=Evansella tamaricis TaxID=2069301 RepID=A0ABS6JLA8_9BACI|nr:hypothetical protein [Evansella tamaricis]MBU9713210.1 hypothetical protein [Evansella tamaricis]